MGSIGLNSENYPLERDIVILAADGSTARTLLVVTDEAPCDTRAAFSPDGTQVAYHDGNCQPMLINADGTGDPVPLTEFPLWWTNVVYPQWGGSQTTSEANQ